MPTTIYRIKYENFHGTTFSKYYIHQERAIETFQEFAKKKENMPNYYCEEVNKNVPEGCSMAVLLYYDNLINKFTYIILQKLPVKEVIVDI